MIAQRIGRTITDEEVDGLVEQMSPLPPHPEVYEALCRPGDAPAKIAALNNSIRRGRAAARCGTAARPLR